LECEADFVADASQQAPSLDSIPKVLEFLKKNLPGIQ